MQHTQVQPSTPATNEQIAAALQILFNSMPFPRGTDPEKAVMGYIGALQGFPIEAIAHGIRRFLRGEFEDFSKKFCPHPPELADIVRRTMPSRPTRISTGKVYYYRQPASKLLLRKCSKGYAFDMIDRGVYPRGSIWCPGPLDDRPEIGDLFGPDPTWKPARPIPQPEKSAA